MSKMKLRKIAGVPVQFSFKNSSGQGFSLTGLVSARLSIKVSTLDTAYIVDVDTAITPGGLTVVGDVLSWTPDSNALVPFTVGAEYVAELLLRYSGQTYHTEVFPILVEGGVAS